jgi:hypothetical protein
MDYLCIERGFIERGAERGFIPDRAEVLLSQQMDYFYIERGFIERGIELGFIECGIERGFILDGDVSAQP